MPDPRQKLADEPRTADLELVRRARVGEVAASEQLVERLRCVIQRGIGGGGVQPLDVEEIQQESFLALWRKLGGYDGTRPIEAWAWGFVVVQCLKVREKRSREASYRESTDSQLACEVGEVESGDDLRVVRESIERLKPTQSIIVRLLHFEGCSFSEAAEQLGLPRGTVKAKYYRGLAVLRRRLLSFWSGYEA